MKIFGINIINENNIILNPNLSPILFYWNEENGIEDELISIDKIKLFLVNNCCDVNKYTKIKLYYFLFDEETENTMNSSLDLQVLLSLDKFDSNELIKSIIIDNFNYLYKCSFKTEYEFTNPLEFESDIKEIYSALKTKYKEKISINIITNFIRSKLLENNFSLLNCDYIINKLLSILNE